MWLWVSLSASLDLGDLLRDTSDEIPLLTDSPQWAISLFHCDHLLISLDFQPPKETCLNSKCVSTAKAGSELCVALEARGGGGRFAVLCLVTQLCPTLCDPMDCRPPDFSVQGGSQGKNTRVGCHALLQGIFPTQGSNPDLLHCKRILYHLSHQRSPRVREAVGEKSMKKAPDLLGVLPVQTTCLLE